MLLWNTSSSPCLGQKASKHNLSKRFLRSARGPARQARPPVHLSSTHLAASEERAARRALKPQRAGCTCHHGPLRAAPGAPRPRRRAHLKRGAHVEPLPLRGTQERRTGRKDVVGRPRRRGPHLHEPLWRARLETGRRLEAGRLAPDQGHPVDGARLDRSRNEGQRS